MRNHRGNANEKLAEKVHDDEMKLYNEEDGQNLLQQQEDPTSQS